MARPTTFDTPADRVLRVRVTEEQRRELEKIAKENKTDISGVIRDAVNDYVSDYSDDEKPFRRP